MAGMWQLPTREAPGPAGLTGLFPARFPGPGAGSDGGGTPSAEPVALGAELGEVRHGITYHRIRAAVRRGRWRDGRRVSAPYRWFDPRVLGDVATTGMTRKVLRGRAWRGAAAAP
jgi:hypothetical protein